MSHTMGDKSKSLLHLRSQRSPHERGVSVCEYVHQSVLRLIPDSSQGQSARTVLIRKLGRVHPRTSVP